PAQNASGNWIKIVQRVPVRIGLDRNDIAAHPLQVGLSMQVKVDTHDQAGERLPRVALPHTVDAESVFGAVERQADDRVKAIIAGRDEPRSAAIAAVAAPSRNTYVAVARVR